MQTLGVRRPLLAVVMVLAAACGGGDEASPASAGTTATSAPAGTDGTVASETVESSGVTRAGDELLPELAGFPVPDGASPRSGIVTAGFASQVVATDLSIEDATRFYLERLPGAGFTITEDGAQTVDDIRPGQPNIITFADADGHPGNLVVQTGQGTTSVNVSLDLR